MIAYAAPVGVNNGACRQVIYINEYTSQHEQSSMPEVFTEEQRRHYHWHRYMKKHMKKKGRRKGT